MESSDMKFSALTAKMKHVNNLSDNKKATIDIPQLKISHLERVSKKLWLGSLKFLLLNGLSTIYLFFDKYYLWFISSLVTANCC